MRRALALGLLLFGVYAATIGLDAFGDSEYGGDEPHYLLAAQSIVDDHDIDVKNQYAARSYEVFYPYTLDKHGRETNGRLNEPHGVGFPLLIAPAYAIGGAKGVELFLAALAALLMALAYRLALRVVPDPWALGAALAVGVSPPFMAYGTAVYPELTAARRWWAPRCSRCGWTSSVSRRAAFGCFALLGLLPWLGTKFVPAGIVIGAVRRAQPVPRAAADAGAGVGGGGALQRRAVRGHQRVALRRADPVHRRRGRRDAPPTPRSRSATSSARTGWWRCSSTATTACCAGRRCSCWRSWAWLLYRSRRDQLSLAVPGLHCDAGRGRRCAPPRWARSCWWRASSRPRCSASGSRRGTCWPRCRWRCRWWPGGCAACRAPASRWRC